jgi:3-hydroxyacyl-CoA dehydrogenase / enoyl-CoA hydratase / 3-hydroxybutyryl-CoA epimerase
VNEEIYAKLAGAVPAERVVIDEQQILDRTLLVMVNEAARVLEDGIVATPGEVDLAMITGTGFPPFRGGLLRWADSLGMDTVRRRLQQLEAAHGVRFAPARMIVEQPAFYGGGA